MDPLATEGATMRYSGPKSSTVRFAEMRTACSGVVDVMISIVAKEGKPSCGGRAWNEGRAH
jgi:hypothetical protein